MPLAAVAVAAPTYAASATACVVEQNYANITVGTSPTTLKFAPSSITATISYSSSGNGGDSTPGNTGKVAETSTNPSWRYIEVEMLDTLSKGDSVVVTITFSQAVSNLSFTVHDIDWKSGEWLDEVIVTSPSGYTALMGSNLTGTGTSDSPFKNMYEGDPDIQSGNNAVRLTWSTAVSQVKFTYRAGISGDANNQHIGIGAISFSDCAAKSAGGTAAVSAPLSLEPVPGNARSASGNDVARDDG